MRSPGPFILACLLAVTITLPAGIAHADEPAEAPTISVSPDHFAFGPINIGGELGEPGEFTVTNTGPSTAHLAEAGVTGPNRLSFPLLPNASTCYFLEPPGDLAPGASCTLVTIFDPVEEGPNQASLELISDAASSPDLMPLTGTGFPRLLPGAGLAPRSGDFGRIPVGTVSGTQAFTLTSNGSGDLDIGPLFLSGPDADQFKVESNKCSGRVMASGDSCRIEVAFMPSSGGSMNAGFEITTDADEVASAELTGTAIAEPPVERSSRVRIGARLPRLSPSGFQAIPLRCSTEGMKSCHGRIILKARGGGLRPGHNRPVVIGSKPYSLRPGQQVVRVRLGHRASRIVRRNGWLRVRVVATSRQGNGSFRKVDSGRRLRR